MLEPAHWSKAILTGPHTQNFQSIADLLRRAGALTIVSDAETLAAALRQWLAHPEMRRASGERARAALAAQAGSTMKTVDLLREHLGSAVLAA